LVSFYVNLQAKRKAPRWERRKDARPEEIMAAALELFVERGFAATRLEDVAAHAGVAKGTLYLYFDGKEELFKAVVREGIVLPLAEIRALVDRHQGSMAELLRQILRNWWERIGSARISGIPKLVVAEARNFPEIARFYVEEVLSPGQEILTIIVKRGIERGEFRPVEPAMAAQVMTAPLLWLLLWRNSLEPHAAPMDPWVYLETSLEMLRRGLAPEPCAGTPPGE
jgi:AcrR family transcriptional regulator